MRRSGGRGVVAVAAFAALIIAAASCGGGGATNDRTPASTVEQAGSTPSGAATSPGAATSTATRDGASGGGSDDIKAVAKKFSESTFRANYRLTSTTTPDGGIGDGQMVLYKQGEQRFRFDVKTTQDGKDISVIFIQNDNNKSLFCLGDAGELGALFGIESGQGVCVNSDTSEANPVGSISETFADLASENISVLETSKRTIVGREADCFRAKDDRTAAINTICFSGDGALLYAKGEGSDMSEIEATDVSAEVNDIDFNAPYEIKDIPGLGGVSAP